MDNKIKVAVIFGGKSTEHEVSCLSAMSILENIDRNKYDVSMIGITDQGRWLDYKGPIELIADGGWQSYTHNSTNTENLTKAESDATGAVSDSESDATADISGAVSDATADVAAALIKISGMDEKQKIDVVFPVLHGRNGEDGTIQGMLELSGIPYVGCGVIGSALGMDKGFAKIIFDKEGIPQGKYRVVTKEDLSDNADNIFNEIEKEFGYPCFIKPCNSGSSVGVGKAHNSEELLLCLKNAARYDRRIIVEEFIDGRELECGVLGNYYPQASVVGEIKPCNEFYDYDAKYSETSTSEAIIPADISKETSDLLRSYAVRAFKALDCCGLARVDFFLEKNTGRLCINEINTMPGFTRISMFPKLWEATGVPYNKLIDKLIMLAVEKQN